jgi:hypothetical protein
VFWHSSGFVFGAQNNGGVVNPFDLLTYSENALFFSRDEQNHWHQITRFVAMARFAGMEECPHIFEGSAILIIDESPLVSSQKSEAA